MALECLRSALLVRITGPDPKTLKIKNRSFYSAEAGKTSLSCSGFVAGNNIVITSAWLVSSFIQENNPNGGLINETKLDCCGEDGVWRPAELVQIWRGGERVNRAIRELTSGLTEELVVRGVSQYDLAVLYCETEGLRPVLNEDQVIPAKYLFDARPSDRGKPLLVVSSAFGLVSPTVFRNSVTRGVLSNMVQSGPSSNAIPDLCLTDARCLAGSEGAPVFEASSGRFLGVVLPPPLRKEKEGQPAVELGLILPHHLFWNDCVLKRSNLSQGANGRSIHSNAARALSQQQQGSRGRALSTQATAAQSVCLIRIGANWGSGVLISKNAETGDGMVLTCAHVVKPHLDTKEPISVSFRGCMNPPVDRAGQVKYCCEGPVDIAFVSVPRLPTWIEPAVMAVEDNAVYNGTEVSAVGHAIFEPSGMLGRNATISTGTLSRVVQLDEKQPPALLQTCAQVFRGHSGGMLCDDKGRLVGIITSNARHSDGSIIPEINFAVPLSLLRDVLRVCLTDPSKLASAAKAFDDACKTNGQLKMLWALQPVECIDPPPKVGGGSFYQFFAKFLESKL